jgi:E3 ubiquitin-protein ligase RGLG
VPIDHFLNFFYYFRRRHRITPRVALPPPTRNAYSRSTSFSQQSGVYSRSSSFDQQTSGFQQRSESLKQQQPAATRRPDTYAAESALEDRLVHIYLSYFHHPRSFYAQIKVKLNHWKFDFTSVFTCY